ncbi:MAG: nucleotidyltransferase domain-containing protein [Chitinispirillales bacterium]|jgi:predicted nucleotidyltransferase|nr:nucleotidyltransferase domain-containing protein [Chitinispirillales bacterium]
MTRYVEKNWHVVEEMTERLKALKPYKVVLFGSYARGTATEDSDLDVMVVLDSNERSRRFDDFIERGKPVSAAVRELRKTIPMDLIVYTLAEFEYLIHEKDFFVGEIMESGKVLYEK